MRQSFRGLVYSMRKYGLCSKSEWLSVLFSSIIFGFIFSFRMWGEVFDPVLGIYNWFMYSLFSALAILSMIFGYKVMAHEMGYLAEFKVWKTGLILNTFICFLTNGLAIFLTPGGFELKRNEGTQVGKFKWGILYTEKAFLVFWGFFSLVLYTMLVKLIFPLKLAVGMTTTAYVIALWSLAPIDIVFKFFFKEAPNSNGTCLIAGPKTFALFVIVFLGISAGLNYILPAFWPMIVALILGLMFYVIFYGFYDPKKKLYK